VDGELQRAINKANMAAGVVVGQGKLKDYFTHHSGCCHTDHHSIAEKIIHHFE